MARSPTVSWHRGSAKAKTILPSSYPTPANYTVALHPTSGSDITQSGLTSTSWTFNDLSAAAYTITVTGLDGGENALVSGTGSADLTTAAEEDPSINLNYISSGTGAGQIHLTFDASGAGVTVSSASLTLVGPSGSVIVNGASLSGSSPTFAYSNTSVKAGSYLLSARFDTASAAAVKMDTVVVFQGVDTSATISLAASDFTSAYVPVTELSLNTSSLTLILGSPAQTLTATLSPANASNPLVSWSLNNIAVATVDQSGAVTSAADGTAMITAAAADNPTITAACLVTVSQYNLTVNAGTGVRSSLLPRARSR